MNASPRIYELRQYTLHPGRRDELITLFEREFVESQFACDIRLDGLFTDPERPEHFVWIRSFDDMTSRHDALSAFYTGPTWLLHREAANATMIDSDDVLLLDGPATFAKGTARGPLHCAIYACAPESLAEFQRRFHDDIQTSLRAAGIGTIAVFVTGALANTYTALPVREDCCALVAIYGGGDAAHIARTGPSTLFELVPTSRSPLQTAHAGVAHDFDFLAGQWRVTHHRLRERLKYSRDWDRYEGTCRAYSMLDGLVSADEITINDGEKGTSFRHLDLERSRWSIYWTNNRTGALFAPVHGGFANGRGEFYGYDRVAEQTVLVRYIWSDCDTAAPRWEQAFSIDGGAAWETNWIMDFRR